MENSSMANSPMANSLLIWNSILNPPNKTSDYIIVAPDFIDILTYRTEEKSFYKGATRYKLDSDALWSECPHMIRKQDPSPKLPPLYDKAPSVHFKGEGWTRTESFVTDVSRKTEAWLKKIDRYDEDEKQEIDEWTEEDDRWLEEKDKESSTD